MDKAIIGFLHANYVLSLSVVQNNKPWSANCFYSFDEGNKHLIFISHANTDHYQILKKNHNVSGTVAGQTKSVVHIQGIQYTGKVLAPSEGVIKNANSLYYERFPFARLVRAKLWIIELDYVKYTDNTLGFGKKICWER